MRVNVFGLGYVGVVSATCFANNGKTVLGIDINQLKIDMLNQGRSPVIEPGLEEAIRRSVSGGTLSAAPRVNGPADVSIICVGTPSRENGSLDLGFIERVTKQIGQYLRLLDCYHVVDVRSTVLPGTVEEFIIPLLERESGRKAGEDFGVCFNPEFLREGTSLSDFYNPPFTVIGELDQRSGDVVAALYEGIEAPVLRTSLRVAEMVKYTCNAFHALKVTFANEIGNLCKNLHMDSQEVMDIFCKDTKLNLSSYYLQPGFAFGGSCLPKDLRALLYKSKQLDLDCPVLSAILPSNSNQIEAAYRLVKKSGMKEVGVLGLSFKSGSDDLRESPIVSLVERLIGKGYSVSLYDKEVSLAKIFGSNKSYIESTIPHISCLMKDSIEDVIASSQVILLGKKNKHFLNAVAALNGEKVVVDLVRLLPDPQSRGKGYEGICW